MAASLTIHVSYHFQSIRSKKSGFGDCVIQNSPRRIENAEDINSLKLRLREELIETDGLLEPTVVILNWQTIP